jgi:NADPH2:quinone reductase
VSTSEMGQEMMRAVGFTTQGGPEVMGVVEVPKPEPREDQIRIRVHAAAVNPADASRRSGKYPGSVEGDPPWWVGLDVAGVVEQSVPGGRFKVGDKVMAMVVPYGGRRGGQAELAVTSESLAAPMPDGVSFVQAACLPMNGVTAHMAARELGLPEGSHVAVTGGAGVLASYFIAMARRRGWHVYADAAPEDQEAVESFGAHTVIPRSDDFARTLRSVLPQGVDGLLDAATIGIPAQAAVRDGGHYVAVRPLESGNSDVYGNTRVDQSGSAKSGPRSSLDQPGSGERGLRSTLVVVTGYANTKDALQEVYELVSDGAIVPRVVEVFAPEQAVEAHQRLAKGGLRGRLVFQFA